MQKLEILIPMMKTTGEVVLIIEFLLFHIDIWKIDGNSNISSAHKYFRNAGSPISKNPLKTEIFGKDQYCWNQKNNRSEDNSFAFPSTPRCRLILNIS